MCYNKTLYTHTSIPTLFIRLGACASAMVLLLFGSVPAYAYLTPDEALNGLFPSQQSPSGAQIPQLHPAVPTLNLGNSQIPTLPTATNQIPTLPTPDDSIIPQLPNGGDDIIPQLPNGSSSSNGGSTSGGGGYDPNCAAYGCPYGYNYGPNYGPYQNGPYGYPDGYKPYTPALSIGNNNSGAPLSHTGPGLMIAIASLGLSALWTIRKAVKAEAMA